MFVTIPLRSLTTSLFITIINALIEVSCLSAVLVIIAANECRKLRKGEAINIRTHCSSIRFVTIAAMLMFVTLEVLISINSEVGFRNKNAQQDCVTTREGIISENDSPASEAITLRCMKVTGSVYYFRTGNYSNIDGSIQCEQKVVYNYTVLNLIEDEPLSGSVRSCEAAICVAVKARGKELFISTPYKEGSDEGVSVAPFIPTTLSFDPEPLLEDIANKVVQLYASQILDEMQIRRLALLGAEDGKCDFRADQKQVTEISTWIVVMLLIVWVLSIGLILVALFIRRYVFYDMNRTWDWATKAYNVPERNFGTDFYIKSSLEGGTHRIFVVSSTTEDNFNDLEMSVEFKPQQELMGNVLD